jgi:hypothetical protein
VHLEHLPAAMATALTNVFFVMVRMTVETDQMKRLVKLQNINIAQDLVSLKNLLA